MLSLRNDTDSLCSMHAKYYCLFMLPPPSLRMLLREGFACRSVRLEVLRMVLLSPQGYEGPHLLSTISNRSAYTLLIVRYRFDLLS